jgi:hypothetical protein
MHLQGTSAIGGVPIQSRTPPPLGGLWATPSVDRDTVHHGRTSRFGCHRSQVSKHGPCTLAIGHVAAVAEGSITLMKRTIWEASALVFSMCSCVASRATGTTQTTSPSLMSRHLTAQARPREWGSIFHRHEYKIPLQPSGGCSHWSEEDVGK